MLQGRLTSYPELKHTKSNKAVVDFSLAVEENRAVNGERNSNFFRCEAWGSTAEFICRYFEKGQQIIVDGRLSSNTYTDKDNVKHTNIFIVVEGVNFVELKVQRLNKKKLKIIQILSWV